MNINIITSTGDLAAFCTEAARRPYVTVDTEFLSEKCYYAKLCLVQLAYQDTAGSDAVLVDVLADGLSLEPLATLFRDENVVKVFHSARQDLEIFYHKGFLPAPLFDTQVAAMFCGFGESPGYANLVREITGASLDKSKQLYNWATRPLSYEAACYALADVTHLRRVYEHLYAQICIRNRSEWIAEAMAALVNPANYAADPADAWKRLSRGAVSPVARELARFREAYAQHRNVPRKYVFDDDDLKKLAAGKPTNRAALDDMRNLTCKPRHFDAGGILDAIQKGLAVREDLSPACEPPPVNQAQAKLLRVLLLAKADGAGVTCGLIAATADLTALAAGNRDSPALAGWRRDVFGNDALRLCEGKAGLVANGSSVVTFDVTEQAHAPFC
ncbi:Ribonuclease D [Diplonema papillatum]|nr:Ribonuclease D [Diplonema papillatum]